jgi:hypothetical protein
MNLYAFADLQSTITQVLFVCCSMYHAPNVSETGPVSLIRWKWRKYADKFIIRKGSGYSNVNYWATFLSLYLKTKMLSCFWSILHNKWTRDNEGEVHFISVHYSKCVFTFWPPLSSCSPSFCLQIQKSGFDSRRYKIFWEVVGLERGPLSLVSETEEI